MSGEAALEILNLTANPMTWAHLEPEGGGSARPVNLLSEAIAPHRGLLVQDLALGPHRLVCGLHGGGEGPGFGEHGKSPVFEVEPGVALSIRIESDAAAGLRFTIGSARTAEAGSAGKDEVAMSFNWSTRKGRHSKT